MGQHLTPVSIYNVQPHLEFVKENPLAPSTQALTPSVVPPSYLACKELHKSGKLEVEQDEPPFSGTVIYNQMVKISGNEIEVREYEEFVIRGRGKIEKDEEEGEEKAVRVRTPEEYAHDAVMNGRRAKSNFIDIINSNWGMLPRGNRPGMKTVKFLTLTYKECMDNLCRAHGDFVKVLDRLDYKLDEKVEYACTWELQKRGAYHLHVLLYCSFIPLQWLKDNWNEANGQGSFDIKRLDYVNNVGRYMAKYMSKDFASVEGVAGKHRYWVSKGLKDKTRKHYVTHKDLTILGGKRQGMSFQDYIDYFGGYIACSKKTGQVSMRQGSFWGAWTGKVDYLKMTLKPCPEVAYLLKCLEESIYWLSS